MRRKLFCELHPICYRISLRKEILLRHLKNRFGRDRLASRRSDEAFPNLVKAHTSLLLRRLHNVDMKLQENKAENIRLACDRLNGTLIRPGETFSFWRGVGKATKRKGYKEGLVIQ